MQMPASTEPTLCISRVQFVDNSRRLVLKPLCINFEYSK